MHSLIRLLTLVALLALPGSVWAQESTLVFGLQADGVAADRLNYLHSELVAGVDLAVGSDAVDAVHQTLSDALMLVGCSQIDPTCVSLLGEAFGAQRVLYGSATQTGSDTRVSVTVHDASDGTIVLFERFDVPTGAPETWVASRLESFLNGFGVIALTGPGIATVEMDGTIVELGVAGTLPNVPIGTHELRVSFLDGRFAVTTVTVDSVGIVPVSVSPELTTVSPPDAQTAPGVRDSGEGGGNGLRITGWSLVGLGGGALVASLVSGLQAKSTQSDFDATQIQSEAYDLRDEGRAQARRSNLFLGIGLGAAAIGTTFVIVGGRDGGTETSLHLGPASASVRARF